MQMHPALAFFIGAAAGALSGGALANAAHGDMTNAVGMLTIAVMGLGVAWLLKMIWEADQ